jgi:hypothetical protein
MLNRHPIFDDYLYDDETNEIYCEYLDRIIKPTKHHSGYMVFIAEDFVNSITKSYRVHRFVMECLLGRKIKEGYVVNHIDGDKTNNLPSNLEEITYSENTIHAYENKLANGKKGEENSQSKLTEEEAKKIPELRANGMSVRHIAELYGVSVKTIYSILSGKRWKHLVK